MIKKMNMKDICQLITGPKIEAIGDNDEYNKVL